MPRQILTARTWTALLWCASLAYAIRGYFGLPGMPYGLDPLAPWAWPVIITATVLTVAGSWLLPRRPLMSIGLLIIASIGAALATDQRTIATLQFVAVAVALGHITATRSRGVGVIAFALTLGQLPAYTATRSLLGFDIPRAVDGSTGGPWAVPALLAVVAWLIGNSVRQVRDYTRRLREQAATQAVTAERLRIARDLHDMVAHSIGIIALQSGAASRVIDTQPAAAREAMIAVETTSRETLSGLRRMLGALRQPETEAEGTLRQPGSEAEGVSRQPGSEAEGASRQPGLEAEGASRQPGAWAEDVVRMSASDAERTLRQWRSDALWQPGSATETEAAPRQPAPTLADIDRLAATTTAAGVRVDVTWQGARRPLPPDLELSAFRIVQESVTNVVRHAAASCEVTLGYDDEHLTIDVADNGRGHPGPDDSGYGLVGMRERVALLHGDLTAAPRPEGGFRVTARLPLPAAVR